MLTESSVLAAAIGGLGKYELLAVGLVLCGIGAGAYAKATGRPVGKWFLAGALLPIALGVWLVLLLIGLFSSNDGRTVTVVEASSPMETFKTEPEEILLAQPMVVTRSVGDVVEIDEQDWSIIAAVRHGASREYTVEPCA